MDQDMPEPEEAAPAATNAVSLFNQGGGVNDFPVLKAFQEYIDAEQAKARKRMFGLSIFFIVLLVVVVITFTIVITSVIGRNQALSDRLLDIALRDKVSPQPVVNVQSPAPAPVVQPVLQPTSESSDLARLREELQRQKEERQAEQAKRDKEKIESLTAALAKAQQQPVAPTPVVVTTSPTPIVQPAAESAELARLREELRREKEERKAEQDKREKEKREAEKEAFLRRQYPDYYAKEDARKAKAARRATAPLPVPAPQPVVVPPSAPAAPQLVVPVHAPLPVTTPLSSKPTPSASVPLSRSTPNAGQGQKQKGMKPVSYFDESEPTEDPELKELLKPRAASQPKQQATVAPAPKPPSQPVAKPTPQPIVKSAPQKSNTAKTAPKPAQPAAASPVQIPAQLSQKTETLAIGGAADGSSIPWLIELPVQQ